AAGRQAADSAPARLPIKRDRRRRRRRRRESRDQTSSFRDRASHAFGAPARDGHALRKRPMSDENPTACLLVIGNEVLSGRTQDANIRFLATGLGARGIPLREVRVIPDVPRTIIETVNEVRAKFDYVFTTGGIGPTHDDITSECIAAAFGVPWEPHPDAWKRMAAVYKDRPGEFNAARQRMATMPRGAVLINNEVSVAPGFTMGNVHVMAGVPRIMQMMFEWLAPSLRGGP